MPRVYCNKTDCSFNRDRSCNTSAISLVKTWGGRLVCNAYTDRPLKKGVFTPRVENES